MLIDEILKKLSEPGDVAVGFIAYATGFILDSVLPQHFPALDLKAPAGTIAGILAIAVIGVKKAIDVRNPHQPLKKRLEGIRSHPNLCNDPALAELARRTSELLNAEVFDSDKYMKHFDNAIDSYLAEKIKSSRELSKMKAAANEILAAASSTDGLEKLDRKHAFATAEENIELAEVTIALHQIKLAAQERNYSSLEQLGQRYRASLGDAK